jgi:hypothetical protein
MCVIHIAPGIHHDSLHCRGLDLGPCTFELAARTAPSIGDSLVALNRFGIPTRQASAVAARPGRDSVMIRSVAKKRIGVLAYASGEREYARRVLRSLGYAPLVFTNLDELTAMGADATTLDMLYLGNMPATDSKGREVLEGVRVVIGPNVPVLRAGLNRARAKPQGVVPGRLRSFSDYYKLILSFLDASCGLESVRSRLLWGPYTFDPLNTTVTFAGQTVQLDDVAFEITLELFFNAGRTLANKRLKQMLSLDRTAFGQGEDYLTRTIADLATKLRLSGAYGWRLETLGPDGYRLSRAEVPTTDIAAETEPHQHSADRLESQYS